MHNNLLKTRVVSKHEACIGCKGISVKFWQPEHFFCLFYLWAVSFAEKESRHQRLSKTRLRQNNQNTYSLFSLPHLTFYEQIRYFMNSTCLSVYVHKHENRRLNTNSQIFT